MGNRIAALQCYRQAEQQRAQAATNPQAPQLVYQLLQSSVINDPTFAEGWSAVGDSNLLFNRLAGAVYSWRRALELPLGDQAGDLTPFKRALIKSNLSEALRRMGRMAEAEKDAREAIEEYPTEIPLAYLNLSQILSATGDLEGSYEAAKKGFALQPDECKLELALAFAELYSRRLADGLRHFESRFPYKLHSFLNYPMPKWDGEEGLSVFLVSDQGIGDTLSFLRFVPHVCKRAAFVHMAVQPELLRLCSAAFQGIRNVNIVPLPCPLPPAQRWTTFVSLPAHLHLTDDEIASAPNIAVPPFTAPNDAWKSSDRVLHIGVAWAGSPSNDIDVWRSFEVTRLLELYDAGPGIQLYSLQVGDKSVALHEAGCASLIRDLSPYIRDISDSIGLLRHLDLVICCESALAHICALMGKECWVPYSYHGREFRIGYDGSDRLWCPGHRIFKQDDTGTWEPVFEQIKLALRARLAATDLQRKLSEAAE